MGYTTYFSGQFDCTPPLTADQVAYLRRFSETRRMARKPGAVDDKPDPLREAVGLPPGQYGDFFVGSTDKYGQDYSSESVLDSNNPPGSPIPAWAWTNAPKVGSIDAGYADPSQRQPGLWCQWLPNEDGTAIVWDEGEKFYSYVEWIEYIIKMFLSLWGVTLSGEVYWDGEDGEDAGVIMVHDNKVETIDASALIRREVERRKEGRT